MTAEQVFEEIKKVESIGYEVVLSSHQCQVFDRLLQYPESFVIDADFSDDMLTNAIQGLEGLYEELLAKAKADGSLEKRQNLYRRRR